MILSQLLLLRRLKCSKSFPHYLFSQIPNAVGFSSLFSAPDPAHQSPPTDKPSSLSARMSFIFEQIDEIDKKSEEKDETLQRIRAWRESKKQQIGPSLEPPEGLKAELVKSEALLVNSDVKEVELVHPWAEWVELMERLLQQNYFDHRRKDEDGMMEGLGLDISEAATEDDRRLDFTRDFKTVQTAVVNFSRDRFDILRSLSRHDLQILVGYGCPSSDKKVAFSSKLLRKHVHLDEGDVCSSCSLRGSCEKAYLLTNKEDEARTIDVMRILLAYGFDPIDGSVENKSLLKMKSVKTVVRKLLHQVVKLSAVPIDPNLPPPVIKKPPPKVKQPPPPPKKRVGRSDVELKKGDWLCPKCDFLNFAKNTVCLQCDAKRPKRQLLPGEWECPQCNFLNYRRNTVCFHCEHKRPPDTYTTESQFPEKQHGPRMRMDKPPDRKDVSNAWNFDFDDNESDGADVATFEYADSQKLDEDFHLGRQTFCEYPRRQHEDGPEMRSRSSKVFERGFSDSSSPVGPGVGFNDFDDDDVDSYEIVSQNEVPKMSRIDFSELEADSESEDVETTEGILHARGNSKYPMRGKKPTHQKAFTNSEDVEVAFDTDDDLPIHQNWKSSHIVNQKRQRRGRDSLTFGFDDDDLGLSSDSDDETLGSKKGGNNRRASNQMNSKTGGRSSFKDDHFSETDSDDELSYHRNKPRDKAVRRGMAAKKSSFNSDFDSGPNRNNRESRERSYNGKSKNARDSNSPKFRSHRQEFSLLSREDDCGIYSYLNAKLAAPVGK
ncbi:zinc finger protein var3 chloroplastic [Phtheirospermum japonicum]|uniref:Zinc finger protein var3 chloroplastic n=1 Tax=Phtheirospermum japonicum TaxID=374723 RepID=A0A830AZZ3_9LAMI|nr:zinc finger protein var3 chloroplastic [Phtheirospermum japonicum]